ncbi:hypothetical protein B7P33_07215 [Sediminicola luteus]|uniref:Uncharacterized protein n=1 Tax=Sediminicola luteus TaxID=319238 RepID=A0A2A4G7J0_9FLAO|nr:hypothetical protein B7P33_07215 [Sediminicola luteus]
MSPVWEVQPTRAPTKSAAQIIMPTFFIIVKFKGLPKNTIGKRTVLVQLQWVIKYFLTVGIKT